jgi:hypothetical protein
MESIYPWHQIAWDISVAEGMIDLQLCTGFKQQIADELCADILAGKLVCWQSDHNPIRKTITLSEMLADPPNLTVSAANAWLKSRGYLYEWAPTPVKTHAQQTQTDFRKLATPEQLIKAFSASTGMKKDWFTGNHSAILKQARVVKGTPGINGMPALYCPMQVMIWLTTKPRGKKLPETNGWTLLEGHFPEVYKEHQAADPR